MVITIGYELDGECFGSEAMAGWDAAREQAGKAFAGFPAACLRRGYLSTEDRGGGWGWGALFHPIL
ncbi:hypothetical protein DVR11_25210, partial [Paracoccus versutus]